MSDLKVSGFSTSLTGMTRAANMAETAAQDILTATTGAFATDVDKAGEGVEPKVDADNVSLSGQAQAVQDVAAENARAAAVAADVSTDGDLAKPLVDLIAAKQAFAASAATMRVTADIEQKLIGMVKS